MFNLFKNKDMDSTLHRPIPAPQPDPEPNPEPDTAIDLTTGAEHDIPTSIIAPDDWDALFHAVVQRLENCVNGQPIKTAEQSLHDEHPVTKKTVLECAAAMNQLHAALKLERQQR